MSDPMQNLNDAAAALNAVAERAGPFWDDADERINAKEDQVDAFVAGADDRFILPNSVGYYDPVVQHNKSTLSASVDPDHNDRTAWVKVPRWSGGSHVASSAATARHVLDLQYGYSYAPGYYEAPQYQIDLSRTRYQFVLASLVSSAAINGAILSDNVEITEHGGWNSGGFSEEISLIGGGYTQLWARFVNRRYDDLEAYSGQDIMTFGGNTGFKVGSLTSYRT